VNRFYSNGKLLLTGEYVVLDGAEALALPTKFGQSLLVKQINGSKIIWESFDKNGTVWFEDEFIITNNKIHKRVHDDNKLSDRLLQILNAAKRLNPSFLNTDSGFYIKTKLDFPKNWGLGTSSTLINNIANWAKIDAYHLLEITFGGSGYDIACAQNNTAITYQLERPLGSNQDDKRVVKEVNFNPEFRDNIYFVFLNKKQNSREGIAHYKATVTNNDQVISDIRDITLKLIDCSNLNKFDDLIYFHEEIISKTIKQNSVKDLLFKDFKGSVKSLGAWGGDFVLVTSTNNPKSYFESKGFNTVIPYADMIL
jgi:mevalonate kinase